jgi:hypothetical protein
VHNGKEKILENLYKKNEMRKIDGFPS